jgi:hypothetical protein
MFKLQSTLKSFALSLLIKRPFLEVFEITLDTKVDA